jgi:hypothetical protein
LHHKANGEIELSRDKDISTRARRRLKLTLTVGLSVACIIAPMSESRGANAFADQSAKATGNQEVMQSPRMQTMVLSGPKLSGSPSDALYQPRSSTASITCSATAGSELLTDCSPGPQDFHEGEPVAIPNGGPPNSLGPPTSHLKAAALTQPGGSLGATSYRYCVTTVDADLGESACSSTVGVDNGATPLGSAQWNQVTWDKVAKAFGYHVYGCAGGNCEPAYSGFAYQALAAEGCEGRGSCEGFPDYGENSSNAANPPRSATRDWVYTTIRSSNAGNSIALGAKLSISGRVKVLHDATASILRGLSTVAAPAGQIPAGGRVKVEVGNYSLVRPLIVPSQVTLEGDCGGTEYDNGEVAPGFVYGTTMTWNGPDRLPAIIVFNGVNQTLRCINLDVRKTQGGESESTGMTGIYISSDTRQVGGTDKTTIDQVTIDGPHLGVQIGGYITFASQQPQTDESETEVHRLHLITRNPNDSDAIGLIIESANAGFASSFFGVTCIGSFSKCFDVKNSGTLYLNSLACGLSGPDRICLSWEAGVTGTVINTIDDDRPAATSRSLLVPSTGQASPEVFTLNLIGNQFNRKIQVDGQLTIASIGNTAGGNPTTWEVNNPASTVHSIADGMKWLSGPSGGTVDQPASLGGNRESGPLAPVVGTAWLNSRRNITGGAVLEGSMLLRATTTLFDPGMIPSNSCAAQSATIVKGATASMVCSASPRSDPGSSFVWDCFPGSASATVRLCNIGNTRAAPSATSFNLSLTR